MYKVSTHIHLWDADGAPTSLDSEYVAEALGLALGMAVPDLQRLLQDQMDRYPKKLRTVSVSFAFHPAVLPGQVKEACKALGLALMDVVEIVPEEQPHKRRKWGPACECPDCLMDYVGRQVMWAARLTVRLRRGVQNGET